MKEIILIIFALLISTLSPVNADEQKSVPLECGSCHGMPPLDESDNDFSPGAHVYHKEINCKRCHLTVGSIDHNDNMIRLLPELNYYSGNNISWPSNSGGSCGGDENFPMPTGCHTEKKNMKCYWMPGKVCKPVSVP